MKDVLLVIALALGVLFVGAIYFWFVPWLLSRDSLIAIALAMVLWFVPSALAVWLAFKIFFKE